jgi:hypothetical protein
VSISARAKMVVCPLSRIDLALTIEILQCTFVLISAARNLLLEDINGRQTID